MLLLVRNHSGVDFSLHKSSTIQRRITRRMVLKQMKALDDYAAFLRKNAKELDALYSDLLISVTSFFRNPAAFETLKQKVFPTLVERRGDDPIRVWISGCSTGQEAYSIVMTLMESFDRTVPAPKVQIFATDLNEAVLTKARAGFYAGSLVQNVSPERLRRFFIEEEGGYRVIKAVREMCVFARHNILSDPPFSRMDLISCRNVMIYIEPEVQKRILQSFHYALKPEGFLFLGASESLGSFTNLFEGTDKQQKIFSKKTGLITTVNEITSGRATSGRATSGRATSGPGEFGSSLNPQREADRITAKQFAPPGVVIDADFHVLQFRGLTGAYLEPPTGKASFDVLRMARQGLMLPLRAAINKARKGNKIVFKENVRVADNGGVRKVNLQVIPLKNLQEHCSLILFEEPSRQKGGRDVSTTPATGPIQKQGAAPRAMRPALEESRRNTELGRELTETQDFIESIQEQHESDAAELQASNEEIQSANEEFQSLNEELETSKEELESTNEELITLNEEMVSRNAELNRLNSDLNNLHISINTAILLLARDLTIRSFTPLAQKMFNLLATDVGRPVGGIKHNLDCPDLERLLMEVIQTISIREREVRDKDGRWYELRARPYITLDNKVDGVVLVLVDIHALKQGEQHIKHARDYAEATLRTARDSLVVLRNDLRVDKANDAFYKTFKVVPTETEGRLLYELDGGQWNIPRLRELLEDILPRKSFFNDFEVTHEFDRIGRRTMLLNARRLDSEAGTPERILLSIEDITERLQAQAALRASETRYRRLFEAAKDGVLIVDPGTRKITDVNPFLIEFLGYTREEFLGKELWEIGLLKDEKVSQQMFQGLKEKGFVSYDNLPLESKTGERREVEVVANLYQEDEQPVIQCNIRDIAERRQATERLRKSEANLAAAQRMTHLGSWEMDLVHLDDISRNPLRWSDEAFRIFGYEPGAIAASSENFFRGVHPEDRRCIRETLVKSIQDRRPYDLIHRIILPGGTERIVHEHSDIICDPESGQVLRMIGTVQDITDLKAAEEEIRVSERRYRRLFEAAKDGVLIVDPDTRKITDVNPFMTVFLGYTREEFLGKELWELGLLKDEQASQLVFQELKEKGFIRYDDLPLEGKTGERREIEVVANLYDEENEQPVIQFNIRDITERKRAEQISQRLVAIVESSIDAIFSKDLEGFIASWNQGAEQLFGYSAQEAIGQPTLILIPLERLEVELEILARIRRSEHVGHYETVLRRKDGGLVEVSMSVSPIRNAQGKIIGTSKIARDITERRRADEALRAAEEKFRALFENAVDGIFQSTPEGRYVTVNPAFARILGYDSPEEVVQNCSDSARQIYVDPLDRDKFKRLLQTVGVVTGLEHEAWRKDRSRVWVSLSARLVRNGSGDGVLYDGSIKDVTARKHAEHEILRLNADLEQRVAARTAELEAVNRELEAFCYSVSHDLRAPLRHVIGFVELLRANVAPTLTEVNLCHLKNISQAARRMGDLVDDLLAFSRVGRLEMQKTAVDLNEMVRETLDHLQAEIGQRDIVWEIHPLPTVPADRSMLGLVLINLISNAVKFTGTRAQAKIEIGCVPHDNGEIVIFIRDNGVGFDPTYIDKLFGVFQRLHSNDEFEGTGIGLANVLRIVQRHGGRTWAEGAVDAGATFYFSIPQTDGRINES
ncbi:MAG: PAS domain S-box protein [Verrucomicrobiota bacterium]